MSIEVASGHDFVVLGDCARVLPTLPDSSFQLIYIDPPFNTGKVQQRRTIRTVRDSEGDRIGFQGQRYTTTEVSRPTGTDVEAYQVKNHAIQEICNKQQFGSGDRHYLGVQWTLWDGQLVITMMITVTVLHETLRIEVTGHALGPVHSLFTSGPAAKVKAVPKAIKF